MSKRSYRRLAVVAGAALALGSMAPAMAQRVDVDADADADATVKVDLDHSDDTPGLGYLPLDDAKHLLFGTGWLVKGIVFGVGDDLLDGDDDDADCGIAVVGCNDINVGDINVLSDDEDGGFDGASVDGDDDDADCGIAVVGCNDINVGDINVLSGDGFGLGHDGIGLGHIIGPVHGVVSPVVGHVLNLDPHVGVLAAVFASL